MTSPSAGSGPVLVGYLAGKCGHAPLNLAVEIAALLKAPLVVVAVVPQPWKTPGLAKVDAEFASYAQQLGQDSHQEAETYLGTFSHGVEVSYIQVPSRTAGDGLLEAVEQTDARVLVVGSSCDGALGQVVLGSTTDWLLHSSPVPVALSPRGYRRSKSGSLTRVTCAYSGTPESVHAVELMAEISSELGAEMRVVSFAVRGRTMFPPLVGLHSEDAMLQSLSHQLHESSAALKANGVIPENIEVQVIAGDGWAGALDAAEWEDGDILALGTTSRRSIKGVFLGSHSAKIIRHSPVPVLVLPA